MKKILVLVMALMVVGCQESVNDNENWHKVADAGWYGVYCVRDVEYIVSRGAITPLLKPDGTISTCLDEQSLIEYMEDMEYHNE